MRGQAEFPAARAIAFALAAALGCGAPRPAPERRSGASATSARLAEARREMGLAEAVAGGAQDDARSFALGAERLPALPTDVDPGAPPLRDGLMRAERALAIARPEPDRTATVADLQAWVEHDYTNWLQERGRALREARQALAQAEAGALGEHVVASAVIGLLFARFAEAIATMPLPDAVASDEAARLRFRDAFLRAAAPLFDRAADAFGACAAATVGARDASLAAWQRHCDEWIERMHDAPRPTP